MIKHVITMDKETFNTLEVLISHLKYETSQLEPSYRQGQFERYIREIEELLGISIVVPEVITAEWLMTDDMDFRTHCKCSKCGYHMATIGEFDIHRYLPSECPNCKAVMTNA